MVYKWRAGSQFKISAQKAGERIEEIKSNIKRGLKANDVVEDAARPSSPLHKAFDWSDASAAYQHRLAVARNLLGALITVVVDVTRPNDEPRQVRSYVSLRDSGTRRDRTFYPLAQVLGDEGKREQLLLSALRDFRAWRDRYKQFEELAEIFEAGNLVIGRLPRKFKKAA